jgi:phenylpyruvate tautomerase PptA (4-oxalocrotonate tautomerase family)
MLVTKDWYSWHGTTFCNLRQCEDTGTNILNRIVLTPPKLERTRMPQYTVITEHDYVPDETKATLAEEITRIHAAVMKVPKNFVRVMFLFYPEHSGYTAGKEAPTAALNCVLRSGHTVEEKTELLKQLWSVFQKLTGIATDQLAISLQEIPSSNAMEMGRIMPMVGHE